MLEAFSDRNWESIRCKLKAGRAIDATPAQEESLGSFEETEEGNSKTVTLNGLKERISSLEDLVRVCKIDTEVWDVVRHTVKAYQGYIKNEQNEIETAQLYSVAAHLKAKNPLLRSFREELQRIAEEPRTSITAFPVPERCDGNVLASINLHDLHVGKYAWGKECGADYDVNIAEKLLIEAIGDILKKLQPWDVCKYVLTVGSDLLNSDNSENTTSHGTLQTTDGRHKRTFQRVCTLMRKVIDHLLQTAPVHVVVIPGNHDADMAFAVGVLLEAAYENCEHVTVDNGPAPRKYVEFGKCLIGFTHGDEVKLTDLPNTMAEECADAWGRTYWRCFDTGHLHKHQIAQFPGVTVRINPALCAPEDWHTSKGFVGNVRALHAELWSRESGNIASLSSDPVQPSRANVIAI